MSAGRGVDHVDAHRDRSNHAPDQAAANHEKLSGMSSRRSFREETKHRLRESVLDAAFERTVEVGWKQVRLADIAEQVGVSRQTIYNEFGSKETLGQELIMRETGTFLDSTLRHLAAYPGQLTLGVAAAVTFALRRAGENPLLRAILLNARGGESELLPMLTTRSEPVLRLAAEVLTDFITEQSPELDRAEVSMGAESIVRLIVSHMVLPLHSTEEIAAHVALIVQRYLRLPPVDLGGGPPTGDREDVVRQVIAAAQRA